MNDPVTAADGSASLTERIWRHSRTSVLRPALPAARCTGRKRNCRRCDRFPEDGKTDVKWLHRLWQAIENDGIDYLFSCRTGGGSCAVPVKLPLVGRNRFLGVLRTASAEPAARKTVCAEPVSVSPACSWRAAIRN